MPVDITAHNALRLSALQTHLPAPPASPPGGAASAASITLHTTSTIPAHTFTACFELVAKNMMAMYKRSSMGWSAPAKRREMMMPAMRFLVMSIPAGEDAEEEVLGFASFMVTQEEGEEVIYCYELQLAESVRGVGHGARLMQVLEGFGKNVGLAKAMLTVFAENTGAMRFYRRAGYDIDKISPKPRVLRSGEVRDPSYYIFSKAI
ncbi:acyl-CoA N-acyltransferase [Sphaerosporella brunnea]|uniref:N-alpha-acetyltransferase 40 n=1 Tax=Sphaerosporella brunnea TaxID=1250544 RepID=A0A5J5F8A9_9PEZI|nr:acyl-CoA N-acyltransferase [Sphaerosporella brunnea]